MRLATAKQMCPICQKGNTLLLSMTEHTKFLQLDSKQPFIEQIFKVDSKSLYTIEQVGKRKFSDLLSFPDLLDLIVSYSVDLALCKTYVRHANARGWCAYREHRQNDWAFVDCQHANLRPNHRPRDCKGYGEVDAKASMNKRSPTQEIGLLQ